MCASPPSGCASPTARATPTAPACPARVEGTALDGLIGEWRDNGERKYYLSNLPPRTSLRALAAAIKARWVCEQAHQQLKQELGLGHFEGRSWTGLHRHALMTCMAFAWLQHLSLAGQRSTGVGGKCRVVFRDRHHLQACQPCTAPSWRGYLQILSRPSDVRTADANSGQHLTSDCPGSARCLVAEHCWAPVGLAVVDHAYRFERLGAPASGRG